MGLGMDRMETIRTDWNRDIHKFKFEELHILLDINSGSVHIIDEDNLGFA